MFRKKKQQQTQPQPIKTKPIDLCYVHIGKLWDTVAVPKAQVDRILRETHGAFIEVDIYRCSGFDPSNWPINFNLYEPVAPFSLKVNPTMVVAISEIKNAVSRDYTEDEQPTEVG